MPKYFFPKFLDRIYLRKGIGTIAPGDWDKKLNICIMQTCNLKEQLDADKIDIVEYINSGRTLSLSDHVERVDGTIQTFLISTNDKCTDEERQLLTPYTTRIVGSKGSEKHAQLVKRTLHELTNESDPAQAARTEYEKGGMQHNIDILKSLLDVQEPEPQPVSLSGV